MPQQPEAATTSDPAEASGDAAAQTAGQGKEPVEEELSEEEKGRRIAAQWTHDPEAVGVTIQPFGVHRA